jgi:glycosyltransferase involved in cell wall biosynthesis
VRILQVTPYYESAWAYGGIPRVVSALSNALVARGHEVTVCTTDARDAQSRLTPDERLGNGVALRVFSNLSNTLAYHLQLFVPLGLKDFLDGPQARFDVAHIHGCHHLPGSIAARSLRKAGVPYALTAHGTAPRLERRRAAKWVFDQTLGRGVLPGAQRVVAVSRAEVAQLRRLEVAEAAIRVIPNPVALAEFEPAPRRGAFRERLGLGGGPLVLFLGKLTPRKGVDLLARAFAGLSRPDATLLVAGNDLGAGAALEREVARRGLGARFRRVGLLRGEERLAALADADVVVYPSQHEIFGLVPLEALLCGAPVVVCDDSGCGELISEVGGGLLTRFGDVAGLTAALEQILSAPEAWRARALAAQPQVRRRFAAEEIGAAHEALYRELLA